MGKSSKGKKNKKADFQKVKLKVGRKLKKGNVVDTTFKAKKIVIKEQIKNDENCSKIELNDRNYKDCIRRLSHYNDASRQDALKSLKDMLSHNSFLIKTNIHQLIDKLSVLFTDKCGTLRKLTVAALSTVIGEISDEHMVPFFPILVTHLRCAATHLSHDVQKDALLIVDLLVQHFPRQVRYFSKSLLEDIVNLMSSHSSSSARNNQFRKSDQQQKSGGGSLNINLTFKVTNVSWHLQLCQRLNKILANICANLERDSDIREKNLNCVQFIRRETAFAPINNYQLTTTKVTNSDQVVNYFEDLNKFKSVTSRVIPLICEMWVEAGFLSDVIDNADEAHNQQIEMFTCLMEILRSVWILVESWKEEDVSACSTWFVKNFGNDIFQHCFKIFPYADKGNRIKRKKGGKKKKVPISLASASELNLLMCDVMFRFTPWVVTDKAQQLLETCVNYVKNLLNDFLEKNTSIKLEPLLSVVEKCMVLKNINADLFVDLLNLFEFVNPGTPEFNCYVSFMEKVLKNTLIDKSEDIVYRSWFVKLLKSTIMCNVIPISLFNILKHISTKANEIFVKDSFETIFPQLIENLLQIKVNEGNTLSAQQIVINLLYWIPEINAKIFKSITLLIINEKTELILSSYIIEVLSNRYRREVVYNKEEQMLFINFLLTTSIGCSQLQLAEIGKDIQNRSFSQLSEFFDRKVHICLNSKESVSFQHSLIELSLKALHNFNSELDIKAFMKIFFVKFLDKVEVLPLKCAYSVSYMMAQIWQNDGPQSSNLSVLANLVILYLEVLSTTDHYSNLLDSLDKVFLIPGLISQCWRQLLVTSQSNLNMDAVEVLGKVTFNLTKLFPKTHAKVIHQILDNLKDRYFESQFQPNWYSMTKYELKINTNIIS